MASFHDRRRTTQSGITQGAGFICCGAAVLVFTSFVVVLEGFCRLRLAHFSATDCRALPLKDDDVVCSCISPKM